MDFRLTEEQELIKNTIREFAETEIEPIAFQLDENNLFPEKIVEEMGRLAIMGLPYPAKYGGAGKDVISYILAVTRVALK